MQCAKRAWVAFALALALAGTSLLASPAPAQADTGNTNCGQSWPSSGSLQTSNWPGSNQYVVTFQFSLTSAELAAMQCAGTYLELDFRIRNFDVPAGWEGYTITGTNLPGAIHDVAYGDPAYQANPAVTRVYTNQLQAGKLYYATMTWVANALPGTTPYIFFVWTPSHWATSDPYESTSCTIWGGNYYAPGDNRNPNEAWCIFPYENITVTLFGNKTFAGGWPAGQLPLDGFRWYDWYPTTSTSGPTDPAASAPAPSPPPLNYQVFAADFNGDHHADIGLRDTSNGNFFIKHGDNFGDQIMYSWAAGTHYQPYAGDFNGDGVADIGMRDPTTGVFFIKHGVNFGDQVTYQWATGAWYQPFAADFNGDGFADIGLRDTTNGNIFIKHGPGFNDQIMYAWAAGTNYQIYAADFNGDGYADIGLRDANNGVFYIKHGLDFGDQITYQWAPGNYQAFAADFNGDGLADIGIRDIANGNIFIKHGPSFGDQILYTWASG